MYNSIIDLNKKFKSSVNLQFDLNNEEKILQYIPTTDLCDVIKIFVKDFLSIETSRAFTLSGPYGKGKSYLMLIIIYLVSKRTNRELFKKVISKFKMIDEELADLILQLDTKNISLLPVIINNNSSEDFNQNFMLALNETLKNHEMLDIVPNSVFAECLNQISIWEAKEKNEFDIFEKCRKSLNISMIELKKGLKKYDLNSYRLFEKLYDCVTFGGRFNPLVSNDISFLYSDVSNKVKNYGYSGLFIIFDEFGVFLENHTVDFASRLNKMQTLAEKCKTSGENNQMHICCITHKDVILYNKDKDLNDEFVKIKGRFKPIRFDRSLEENYEIICSALEKKKGYNEFVKSFVENEHWFIEKIRNSNIFSDNQLDFLFKNGLPFNPLSLYSLINVSEKVGQNERTMFTFLSDNDLYSFRDFITKKKSGTLNVCNIYDYFSYLIKDNEHYKSIFYQVESLLKLTSDNIERQIIKVIGIINVINDDIKFPATKENIELSLKTESIAHSINSLLEKNLIKQDSISKRYNFSVLADKFLNEKINRCIDTKLNNKSLAEILNLFDRNIFHISNKYNFEFEMTRFFRSKFLDYDLFVEISDTKALYDSFADGLIINIISDKALEDQELLKCLREKENNSNVILRYNRKVFDEHIIKKLKTVEAAKLVLLDKDITEIEKTSLELLISDLTFDLNKYISSYLANSSNFNLTLGKADDLSSLIYSSLKDTYNNTIVLVNDQINKNIISKTSAKSRNTVVDYLLKRKTNEFSNTSAEGTILNSFLESIEKNQQFFCLLREEFIHSNGKKTSLSKLVNKLYSKPYGMRKGVIPLYLAKLIDSLSISESKNEVSAIILYNKDREIDLNANNLSRAIDSLNDFSLMYRKLDGQNLKTTLKLMKLFDCKSSNNFSEDVQKLVLAVRKYIYNLEPVIIKSNSNDNILNLSNDEISFKDIFMRTDLNSYDILFEKLPKLFKKDIYNNIELVLNNYNLKKDNLYKYTLSNVKSLLFKCDSSLKSCYDMWASNYDYINSIILSDDLKKIKKCFNDMKYSDEEAIDKLSIAVLNCTLSDWNYNKQEKFLEKISLFIKTVENYEFKSILEKDDFSQEIAYRELSFMGKTLMSNLQESIDEYGESISNEEKVLILKKLLKEIVN